MENDKENDCRDVIIKFRVNKTEAEAFERKFQNSGYRSKSEFIRMMIFQGLIVKIDKEAFKEFRSPIVSIANNINQIAVRVNSTGNIYAEDIEYIKNGVDDIRQQLKSFLSLLQKQKPLPTLPTLKKQKTDD